MEPLPHSTQRGATMPLLMATGALLFLSACARDPAEPVPPESPNNGWAVTAWNWRTHSLCTTPTALLRQGQSGSTSYMARSTDRGATWQEWTISSGSGVMTFVSDLVGFSRVNSDAHRTVDGGHTWSQLPVDPGLVVARPGGPELFGYRRSQTYLSTDEGASWTPLGSDGPGDDVRDMKFVNADTAYATCNADPDVGLMRRTTDGGQSWETLFPVNGTLKMILMRDGLRGVVTAQLENDHSYLYRTTDGWATRDSVDLYATLGSIPPTVVDRSGTMYAMNVYWIFRSTDNGITWTTDYDNQMHDLEFLHGLVQVGDTLVAASYGRMMMKVSP